MKKIIYMAMTVVVTGIAGPAHAQVPPDLTQEEVQIIQHHRERMGEFRAKMKEALGLTDEQAQKLKDHRQAFRSRRQADREAMKNLRVQMKEEFEKPELDVGKIRAIHARIKDAHNKAADDRLEGILEVRRTLTAEQYKKFQEFKEKHKGWGGRGGLRKKHMGEHGGYGFGKVPGTGDGPGGDLDNE